MREKSAGKEILDNAAAGVGTAAATALAEGAAPGTGLFVGLLGGLLRVFFVAHAQRWDLLAHSFAKDIQDRSKWTDEEAIAELEARTSDPRTRKVIYDSLRNSILAVDEELIPPMGRLLRLGTEQDGPEHSVVRDIGEVLARMRATELSVLQRAVAAAIAAAEQFDAENTDDEVCSWVTIDWTAPDLYSERYRDEHTSGVALYVDGGRLPRLHPSGDSTRGVGVTLMGTRPARRVIQLLREYQLADTELTDEFARMTIERVRLLAKVVGICPAKPT